MDFTVGSRQEPPQRTITTRDLASVKNEMDRANRRFGLSEDAQVLGCYEAEPDGFWLYWYLVHLGLRNLVLDLLVVEVSVTVRRAKTGKMHLGQLLFMLM